MKLELKHLAPYLDCRLKYGQKNIKGEVKIGIVDVATIQEVVMYSNLKPILRPLSEYKEFEDILDEFSINSEQEFQEAFFGVLSDSILSKFDHVNYTVMTLFFKYHLDVFGLIEAGLAIDINTLN